jgi:multidrug efflux pump subunit AcrA (membrane-fusion protein)
MHSLSALILCSLLQAGDGNFLAQPPLERLPDTRAQPHHPTQYVPPTIAPQPQVPRSDQNQLILHCRLLMLPKWNDVTIAATERAVLMSLRTEKRDAEGNILRDDEGNPIIVPIREGMHVFKDQVLGNFDDRELKSTLQINQAQLEVAYADREKTIDVIYAAEGVRLAMIELQMIEAANKRFEGTVSELEVKKAEVALVQARANMELQKYNIEEVKTREATVREGELARTEVQIHLRQLIAHIDGMVVEINAAEGEWLREGDPVLKIKQLDTIRAQVFVSAERYEARDLHGKRATVRVPLANGRVETFQGVVVFCDPHIDTKKEFMVYVEVQNPRVDNYWLLQPGFVNAEVIIHL